MWTVCLQEVLLKQEWLHHPWNCDRKIAGNLFISERDDYLFGGNDISYDSGIIYTLLHTLLLVYVYFFFQ